MRVSVLCLQPESISTTRENPREKGRKDPRSPWRGCLCGCECVLCPLASPPCSEREQPRTVDAKERSTQAMTALPAVASLSGLCLLVPACPVCWKDVVEWSGCAVQPRISAFRWVGWEGPQDEARYFFSPCTTQRKHLGLSCLVLFL